VENFTASTREKDNQPASDINWSRWGENTGGRGASREPYSKKTKNRTKKMPLPTKKGGGSQYNVGVPATRLGYKKAEGEGEAGITVAGEKCFQKEKVSTQTQDKGATMAAKGPGPGQ